jgi:hypothetical protein
VALGSGASGVAVTATVGVADGVALGATGVGSGTNVDVAAATSGIGALVPDETVLGADIVGVREGTAWQAVSDEANTRHINARRNITLIPHLVGERRCSRGIIATIHRPRQPKAPRCGSATIVIRRTDRSEGISTEGGTALSSQTAQGVKSSCDIGPNCRLIARESNHKEHFESVQPTRSALQCDVLAHR